MQHIDGNDLGAADAALVAARAVEDRPSLIIARTHIGYGSPHKQDTFKAHGEPLGEDEVRATKRALGWPEDRTFYVPEEALRHFREAVPRGEALEADWRRRLDPRLRKSIHTYIQSYEWMTMKVSYFFPPGDRARVARRLARAPPAEQVEKVKGSSHQLLYGIPLLKGDVMDAHPLGAAPRRRPFQRLSRRSLQCLIGLFTLLSIILGFFMTFPLFSRSSTAYAAGGVQINSGAAWLRQITDKEMSR